MPEDSQKSLTGSPKMNGLGSPRRRVENYNGLQAVISKIKKKKKKSDETCRNFYQRLKKENCFGDKSEVLKLCRKAGIV